jgi:hypothetical protein
MSFLFGALMLFPWLGAANAGTGVEDEPTLETVLAHASDAARRSAWSDLEHGLLLTGTTDAGGIEAEFELILAADGRHRYTAGGRLARTVVFDGTDLVERVRSGPTSAMELADRENWLFEQWTASGYWLDPQCPLQVELLDAVEETVTLQLSFPDSPIAARLVLDRQTWLPRALRCRVMGSESVMTFEHYDVIAGAPVARRIVSVAHGEEVEQRITTGAAAPADPGARYATDTVSATDVHFQRGRGPEVELRRARSGHLLVHPRVDGEDVGWFILDSAAGQICIDPGVADDLGLERFGSVPAVGVAGSVISGFRQAATLQLGPMTIDDPVFVEIDLAFLTPIFGVETAGICGYDVFARAVVELDLHAETLALHDPEAFELESNAWTPLVLDTRSPNIRCRFEGDREGYFKLDLGDTNTIAFYTPAVEALGLLEGREVQPSQVAGVGGAGQASTGDLLWFELGGRRFEPLRVTFSQTDVGVFSSSYALGNLGSRMLDPFVVVFDYPNGRIALLERE